MFSHRNLSPLLLSSFLALPIAAHAAHLAPRYTVNVAGVVGSDAKDINNSGAVVGDFPFAAGVRHAFVNSGGVTTDLGTLGGPNSTANGINDAGDIVGAAQLADGRQRAYRYSGATMTDLGTLGGDNSSAEAINNRGDIVGTAQLGAAANGASRAFLLRPGVSMQDLGVFEVPGTEGGSTGLGLNERRQVVGGSFTGPFTPPESAFHAFLYACEEMRDLGTLGGQFSIADAINARGQVVGEASTPSFRENRAFLWYRGIMTNLGTLPGDDFSSARDINNRGQIVGFSSGPAGRRAFLYQLGTMTNLNTLIDPASGWTLQTASGINNGGQIAATGCNAGLCYALRLDPI